MSKVFTVFVLLIMLSSCTDQVADPVSNLSRDAQQLAHAHLMLDTHIDAPLHMLKYGRDIAVNTDGQFDYPKARAGGLDLAFMSVFVPASVDDKAEGRALADELIEAIKQTAADHPDKFAIVTSPDQAISVFASNRIGLALGMENGGPIQGDLANLDYFHSAGIRYVTLTHSKSNHICDSSYDEDRPWNGLSTFGKRLIPAMNDIGMIIDVSHISDAALLQVLELSRAPIVASHSSARHFTPGFERNLDDDMIEKIASAGGIIQVNFGSGFISEDSRRDGEERTQSIRKQMEEEGVDPSSEEGMQRWRELTSNWPYRFAGIDDLLDHFDHIRDVAGVEHLGFGSDFDGVGDTLPSGIKDVSEYPNLIRGLLQRGYTTSEVAGIMGGNLIRVWRQVESVASLANSQQEM